MFPTQSYGTASIDPNTRHAIEQIASVISDVEQRLQLAKLALAQTVPGALPQFGSFAPLGVQGLPNVGIPNVGYPSAFGSPWASPFVVPYYGSPLGFPTSANPGVIAPFGLTPGMAPTLPFRF